MQLKKTPVGSQGWYDLQLDGAEWVETGDFDNQPAWTRLTCHPMLAIAGLPMHLEAWAIKESDEDDDTSDSHQTTVNPGLREDFERLCTVMDCAFETVTIRGREYAIFAFPHGC